MGFNSKIQMIYNVCIKFRDKSQVDTSFLF